MLSHRMFIGHNSWVCKVNTDYIDRQKEEMGLDGDKGNDISRNSKVELLQLRTEVCTYNCINCTQRYIFETLTRKRMRKPLNGLVHDSENTLRLFPLTMGMPIQLTQTYIAANGSAEMGSIATQMDMHSGSWKSPSPATRTPKK